MRIRMTLKMMMMRMMITSVTWRKAVIMYFWDFIKADDDHRHENVLGLPPWWISFDQTFKFESLIIWILQQQSDFNALEWESKSKRAPPAKNYWISNSPKLETLQCTVDEINFWQTWRNAIRNILKCKLSPEGNNEYEYPEGLHKRTKIWIADLKTKYKP